MPKVQSMFDQQCVPSGSLSLFNVHKRVVTAHCMKVLVEILSQLFIVIRALSIVKGTEQGGFHTRRAGKESDQLIT